MCLILMRPRETGNLVTKKKRLVLKYTQNFRKYLKTIFDIII